MATPVQFDFSTERRPSGVPSTKKSRTETPRRCVLSEGKLSLPRFP